MEEQTFEFETLSKISNNRKYIYRLRVDKFDDHSEIVSEYGIEGKKLKTSTTKYQPKRSFATNIIFEMAKRKATSMFEQRLRTGYSTPDGRSEVFVMLAKEFDKVEYPCYVQPKLDGYRAVFDVAEKTLVSRTGKHFTLSDELIKELSSINEIVLDGELYVHDDDDVTFEQLSVLRKTKLTDEDHNVLSKIKFYVYDIVDKEKTFEDRIKILKEFIESNQFEHIVFVETIKCDTKEDLDTIHEQHVKDSYEGTIIRKMDSLYVGGRTPGLMKMKDFSDSEYEIVGYDKTETGEVIWKCSTSEGLEFNVSSKGTKKERQKIYDDLESGNVDYSDKKLWVRYFDLCDNGVPRFATCMRNGLSFRSE